MQSSNYTKMDEKTESNSLVLPFIAAQSRLLTLNSKLIALKTPVKKLMHDIIDDDSLFKLPSLEKKRLLEKKQLKILWPHKLENKVITIQPAIAPDDTISLEFFDTTKFLTLTLRTNTELIIEHDTKQSPWSNVDAQELANFFNQILHAKKIVYCAKDVLPVMQLIKKGAHRFTKDSLDKSITHYGDRYHFSYKINNCIIRNSIKNINDYKFFLDWTDSHAKQHALTINFTLTKPFESHLFSENVFLNAYPAYNAYKLQAGQCYYFLSITENPPDKKLEKKSILNMWFSSDGLFSELRDLEKGHQLSGNEVIGIYNYFDNLFKPNTTFLFDASKIHPENSHDEICLRVVAAIANDKTWYESKIPGLKLFEQKDFDSGIYGKINQNKIRRLQALHQLQELSLDTWRTMLTQDKQVTLKLLCNTYLPKTIPNSRHTLKMLTQAIFSAAKIKGFSDLASFCKLLHGDMHLPDMSKVIPLKKETDYWLKIRIYELIWGGFVWIKNRDDNVIKDSKAQSLKNHRR